MLFFESEIENRKITLHYTNQLFQKMKVEIYDFSPSAGKSRIPATYQFFEKNTGYRQYDIIKIVAAPGIGIQLFNFPSFPYQPSPLSPLLEVIRVQDPELVPAIGSDFRTHYLLGEYEINRPGYLNAFDPEDKSTNFLVPHNFFSVVRTNDGVILRHHSSRQDLIITVPKFTQDPNFRDGKSFDLEAKFAFKINSSGKLNVYRSNTNNILPLLEIVKTPSVKVELARQPLAYNPFGLAINLFRSTNDIFFQIYEVDKIEDVPYQGEDITPQHSWKKIDYHTIPGGPEIVISPMLTIYLSSLSFLPIIGDVLDVLEFLQGYFSGRDIYGRKLSSSDITMLGVGALLTIASTSGSSLKTLGKFFGRKRYTANKLIKKLRKSSLNKEEAQEFAKIADRIKKRQHISLIESNKYNELLTKLLGEEPSIDLVINSDNTGFTVVELQARYRAYKQRFIKDNIAAMQKNKQIKPASPREWAMRYARDPEALSILKGLLGPDFRSLKKIQGPTIILPKNAVETPRPTEYSLKQAEADLRLLFQDPLITERLTKVLPTNLSGIDAKQLLRSNFINQQIDTGLLNILKGNIAEYFARPLTLDILKNIAKKYPNTVHIDSSRIDLLDHGKLVGKRLQFTDGLFVEFEKKGFRTRGVEEVKSGYKGGQEARDQLFDWTEGRLTSAEGSRIIIPKGTRIMTPDGAIHITNQERSFLFNPGSRNNQVAELITAPRYIITAKGRSHLGLNSAHQINPKAGGTVSLELQRLPSQQRTKTIIRPPQIETLPGITSAQMDYLAVQILGKLGKL